uniref:Uncharacterized protein n=1 Tax=Tanacetum cinerariifolium TaxID=118510 RepID=A0A6L2KYJ2_TANCI|nr:hypothetical protein [Tanacetum cinerariifolium]
MYKVEVIRILAGQVTIFAAIANYSTFSVIYKSKPLTMLLKLLSLFMLKIKIYGVSIREIGGPSAVPAQAIHIHREDDALERRAVELAQCADVMLMLWNDGFSFRKIKPHKDLQCLRMILAQIELLIERALIHDARNKGLQTGALYLMGVIYLTDECVKKDIALALRCFYRASYKLQRSATVSEIPNYGD